MSVKHSRRHILRSEAVDMDIYVDWDIEYRYRRRYYKYLKEAVDYLKKAMIPYRLYERRSSSGNTHIKIDAGLDYNLPDDDLFLLELMVRALARDDAYRLAVDIMRYSKYGIKETNRLFDMKSVKGRVKRAGKWREIKSL